MIKVTIFRDSNGYRGYKFEGHAEYADPGEDVICAAASVLAINTVNSIEQFTCDKIKVNVGEDAGNLELKFLDEVSDESNLLIGALALGVKTIIEDYSEKYIQLLFKEV